MRSTLCHDQAIKWAKAKVHVFSDSVCCLGKMHGHSEANENWKNQISIFQLERRTGKNWKNQPKSMQNWMEFMQNQLSSGGILSQF